MESQNKYRELTWSSVIIAVFVGMILNVGICYAGLQIGFTIVGSTVAAVIGFGIMRGIGGSMKKGVGSILEVNIFQTVASSVNTVNAGVIFTVPVLFILGKEADIDYFSLALATTAGSLMGVVMIIPLRKQIIDFERLRFPEGVAVAAILKSPGAGVQKSMLLVSGIVVAAIVATLTKIEGANGEMILPEAFNLGKALGISGSFRLVLAVSMLSLGAGYLAGRHGLAILYGTILNFWILIPACIYFGWLPAGFESFAFWEGPFGAEHYDVAEKFMGDFAKFTSRHVGIGMILGGAVAGIVVAAPALRAAIASLKSTESGGERHEVSIGVIKIGLAVGFVLLLLAAKFSGGEDDAGVAHVTWGIAIAVAVAGTAWLWLAGLVVAQTTGRTDWSPLSGLALIAIAIMMGIMGTAEHFIVPAVTVGAAVCVATSMCADMMADLKTGYLVGSKPIKQQIAQIATCWIGPSIALFTVILLWNAYGFGPDQAGILYERAVEAGPEAVAALEKAGGSKTTLASGVPALGAPQAGALESAITIVRDGDVPLGKYGTGAALGLGISLLVSPGLGVMVGLSLYLPFMYMIVFGMGGLLNMFVSRLKGARWAEDKGVPVAAGLIVGDALVGVIFAVIEVLGTV